MVYRKGLRIESQRFRIALVLSSLFFPLTYPEVIERLKARGFTITLTTHPPLPFGGRAYLGGRLAGKEDCHVDIDPDRKIIASEGTEIKTALKIFEELQVLLKEDFQVNVDKEIDYVELISDSVIWSEQNPLKCIQKLSEDISKLMDEAGSVLGDKLSLFGLNFMRRGSTPLDKDWLHIRIEPRIPLPERGYLVHIIYRKPKVEEVVNFAEQISDRVIKLIEVIERRSMWQTF